MKYIDNDKKNGIEYDYKKIAREYKKIVKDKEYQFPVRLPWGKVSTMIMMSERSIGKTTNFLIWGLLMWKEYGTIIHYVRTSYRSIEARALKDLFSTIIEHDYISKITDGEYNNVYYYGHRWYLTLTNEDGEIVKQSKHFMFCCSVDKATDLKSSYNCPRGDLVLYDEFVGKFYRQDEFIDFLDLTKTIIRDRFSATFVFLANVIDIESQWYEELECRDLVYTMSIGERNFYTTSLGQQNYIEIMQNTNAEKRSLKNLHNEKYYAYKNSKLNSITGHGWSMQSYQMIPKFSEDTETIVIAYRYIYHNGRCVRLEMSHNNEIGLFVKVVPANRIHDNAICFTLGEIKQSNYRYGLGYTELDKKFYKLYCQNKWYYCLNSNGAFCSNYINLVRKNCK